jgi:ketosteroid isomerase-like protein
VQGFPGNDPDAILEGVTRVDQHSVTRLLETYPVWNDGGLEAVAREYWHDEIELEVPPGWEVLLGTNKAVGRDQVFEVYSAATSAIQDSRIELIDYDEVDGEFVCRIQFRGRGQSSGVDVESLEMFQVIRMEDGLLRRVRFFADADSARSAAGQP